MSRLIFVCLLALIVFSPLAPSGASASSYASEDLRRLSTVERIRVIEQEYSNQNRGRQIPDNQLEYYLDQVNNGWTLSQVRQDMSYSRGNNYGDWRPTNQDWQATEVVCTSDGSDYRECPTPFYGHARVTQQLSKKACREGSTWGQRQGMIWVNKGCRARFGEEQGTYWNQGSGRRATCESKDGRYRECAVNFTGRAQVYKQLSSATCIYNRDWGQRFGMVWVSNGCRAEFVDGNGNQWGNGNTGWNGGPGSKITCASQDNRYIECPTNFTGSAQLTTKLSKKNCLVNRDWGQRGNIIWVNNGCRAEFTDTGVGSYNNNGYDPGYSVTCASNDSRYTTCAWDRYRGQPRLIQQDSVNACIEGQTWGYDYNRGTLWVDRGCRGRFGTR